MRYNLALQAEPNGGIRSLCQVLHPDGSTSLDFTSRMRCHLQELDHPSHSGHRRLGAPRRNIRDVTGQDGPLNSLSIRVGHVNQKR